MMSDFESKPCMALHPDWLDYDSLALAFLELEPYQQTRRVRI
jgi:hypothetical protein